MPISKTIYLCTKCGEQYSNSHEASMCESGLEEFKFKPGDEITYNNESNGMGVRWSYSTQTSKIILCYWKCVINHESEQSFHSPVYVVSQGYVQAAVVETADGSLISPTELKYQPGFVHDAVSQMITDGITGYLYDPNVL